MNVSLLQAIKAHILEEPSRLQMSITLYQDLNPGDYFPAGEWESYGQYVPACGTIGCILGWAEVLTQEHDSKILHFLIDLPNANKLLFVSKWDEPYQHDYQVAVTAKERAEITARYIDYYVEKYNAINACATSTCS